MAAVVAPPTTKRLTYADYRALPDGGKRAEELYWDGAYALARRLRAEHPGIDIAQVTLNMIYNWAIALPDFKDDPQLANDDLLTAIYQEWYEEANPL